MGFSTSSYPSSRGVPLPPNADMFLLFSLCSGCSSGYCFVQRPGVAGDHGMKPGVCGWVRGGGTREAVCGNSCYERNELVCSSPGVGLGISLHSASFLHMDSSPPPSSFLLTS